MKKWQKRRNLWVLAGLLVAASSSFNRAAAQEVAEDPATGSVEIPVEVPVEVDNEPAEESEGLADLDEALRVKVTSNGLRDLTQVIDLLGVAIDKGLDVEDNDFAERMLSDSLMERATLLMRVINTQSIRDQRIQRIRSMATSDLRDVIAYDDPTASAFLMLGKLQALPGGDPREAKRAIDSYLKFEELPDTQRAEALVLRARMTKDPKKSLANMDRAIALAPENVGYQLAKAIFLRQTKKLDEALATIAEVIEQNPENGNAVILQGEIYRQQDRLEEALASFEKATELAPQAPGPYQNRGEIYRQQEEFEKAIAQFSEVLKLQPGVLLTLLHRAEAYTANEQFEEALADIETVLEKQPQLIDAHRLRAQVLVKMDRLDKAIAEIELASEAMPAKLELKSLLAMYYLTDKKPRKAIGAYSDVLDQDPNNFLALQSRGDTNLNIGRHAEAIADFGRALKIRPEEMSLLNNLAWVLATSPEDGLRDGKRAVELATKACELTKYKTPHILSTLAAAFAEDGNFETAIKWSQQAVDLDDPEHAKQLAKELDSYREGQPWREKQNLEENNTSTEPLEESLQGPVPGGVPRRN